MKEIYIKHTGLPIPDLLVGYDIDHENQLVKINLNNEFDSALLISFIGLLEEQEGIKVIDHESHATWGPVGSKGRYHVVIYLAGTFFDAEFAEIGSYGNAERAEGRITVSMHKVDLEKKG